MSTYFPSGKELAGQRKWYVVDAAGQTLGHLASEVASILTGKRNPKWTPFLDTGDHVVVINARQAVLKGNKAEQKVYRHHLSLIHIYEPTRQAEISYAVF